MLLVAGGRVIFTFAELDLTTKIATAAATVVTGLLVKRAPVAWTATTTYFGRPKRIENLMAQLIIDVAQVKAEVNPNGSKSLKDIVTRTEGKVDAMQHELGFDVTARRITEHRATWEGRVISDGTVTPVFVSRLWTRITGQAAADTADGGWTLAVHADHRDRVVAIAADAMLHERPFQVDYPVVNVHTGAETKVRLAANPAWVHDTLVGWVAEISVIP